MKKKKMARAIKKLIIDEIKLSFRLIATIKLYNVMDAKNIIAKPKSQIQ